MTLGQESLRAQSYGTLVSSATTAPKWLQFYTMGPKKQLEFSKELPFHMSSNGNPMDLLRCVGAELKGPELGFVAQKGVFDSTAVSTHFPGTPIH